MDVGCLLKLFVASTKTPQHHSASPTPQLSKNSPPLAQVLQCKGELICLRTYLKGAKTLYISKMEAGSNQRWTTASTITSCPYFHSTVTQNCQNLTQFQLCSISVRVHSYAYIPQWKGAKTLYIWPKWRWEAIKGGNHPQPLHHGIISTWLSPRIAKIWPSFSCVVTV